VSLRDARTNCGRLFQTDAAASGKARQARSLMVTGGGGATSADVLLLVGLTHQELAYRYNGTNV